MKATTRHLSDRSRFFIVAGLFILCGTAAVLGSAVPARANAFTMAENQLLGRLGVSYFLTSNYFDNHGDVEKNVDKLHYRDVSGHLWLRWAVLDSLELGLHPRFRYQYRTYETPEPDSEFQEDTSTEMGDLDLDAQWRIFGNQWVAIAVDGLVKLPYFYDEDAELPPGDGQLDAEGRLLAATRFSLFNAGLDFGYRYRDEDPADLWVYGGEFGFAYSIVYGKLRVEGASSAGNAADDAELRDFLHGPDYALGTTAITFGIKPSNHWRLDLTASHTVWGRNAAQGTTLMLATGVEY